MARFQKKDKAQFFAFLVFGLDKIKEAEQELIQDMIPFEYIIHDKDDHDGDNRIHAHFMLDYGNRTTLNWMIKSYGHLAINEYIVPLSYPDKMDAYFWHDQSIEKAKGKHVYDPSEIKCFNGFDRTNLKVFTENEKMFYMDLIMSIANDMKIYEYAGLLEYLSKMDRMCYRFALNNTIAVNSYITSHRHRYKKKKEVNEGDEMNDRETA